VRAITARTPDGVTRPEYSQDQAGYKP
jgi:hypothetical protein